MDNGVLVLVEYRRNISTGKIHRVVVMPDNGQVLKDEQCNLDQSSGTVVEDFVESQVADPSSLCGHCFVVLMDSV